MVRKNKSNSKLENVLDAKSRDYYVIGETAYNHEGDFQYLCRMTDEIAELKLDAVKFHLLLNAESYLQKKHPLAEKIKKWMFTAEEWLEIIDLAAKKGLEVIALCDDVESIDLILKKRVKVAGIELHMSSLNDYFMMKKLIGYNGIIILGIGGSTMDEIKYAVDFFRKNGRKKLLLMYGFQNYPTNYEEINIRKIATVEKKYKVPVGYADHTAFNNENNELISTAPYMAGVRIFEKHYTPEFGKERIDFQSAIGKDQFRKISGYLDLFKKISGDGSLKMSEAELKYGKIGPMKKAIVARRNIPGGKKIKLEDLWYKRTEEEVKLKQNQIFKLIGSTAAKDIAEDETVTLDKIRKLSKGR
ncbi:MAG: N-acetylneuraminate synthase family protein [Candidatus Paceibacterota bacterium]|jgi:sialic acid synthase SpsE